MGYTHTQTYEEREKLVLLYMRVTDYFEFPSGTNPIKDNFKSSFLNSCERRCIELTN